VQRRRRPDPVDGAAQDSAVLAVKGLLGSSWI
jgi:hypothetical protein